MNPEGLLCVPRENAIEMEKIDKNTHPPKGTRSGKQLFFPYPSVFAESYVRCVYVVHSIPLACFHVIEL